MTLAKLENEMIVATKAGDRFRKNVISGMVDACRKASITAKGRREITEELVNETLLKYSKMVKEMIDTCPESRAELLESYKKQYEIVMQFAPRLEENPEVIREMIFHHIGELELTKANRGLIMKTIMPHFRGKVNMSVTNEVINTLLV